MDVEGGAPFQKHRGWRHFVAAAQYSWQGFKRLLEESAFRQEVAGFLSGCVVLGLVGAGLTRVLIFAGLMVLLFAVEALNTAIEEIVDRVSPEYSSAGRNAKDLGSFAVSCLIGVNGVYFVYTVVAALWL